MANSSRILELTILEREYRINCPEGAEEKLREAARYLNDKMAEIKNAGAATGKVLGTDRIAVIAALNIANQLHELQAEQAETRTSLATIDALVDEALEQDMQLEL
ncbi:MAG: cell division protein ZapA [Oceanospirillaceae bacterium]|uniref:cell division protein ZapA n=1 Tax=unclassified Thalassolituus TaxID=2624967 RepID=UPI000C0A4C29|nr:MULTISPECIES: cell division protein ZapA [unclassified Thalassolituus]MAK89991.1 cell division protein ZapA [Thalassolituus sp.]MAS25486.1 cell division protein ZapA [Oceanospirillaceae bacterium]MAY00040.1 cell division protein ZapA [Oceanospirillaceae bacterium]MBL36271.1 cell division protein ZapA [Oceanospirillaceae bacterium]MBS53788.1 cell division protein ZapA [Oceanospirillaceae bacterium]